MQLEKRCTRCKEVKPSSEFGADNRRRGGLKAVCRPCDSALHYERYDPNKVTEEQRIAVATRNKLRYKERTEKGICLFCDEPAESGFTQCVAHRAAARDRTKSARKEWSKYGLCMRCGKTEPIEGKKICGVCVAASALSRAKTAKLIPGSDKRREYYRKMTQHMKDKVYEAYGGYKCACCNETEPMFLTIDHMNNDGANHRKGLYAGNRVGVIYRWIIKNNYPPDFQILCHNCNSGKHRNGGICPHKVAAK